MTTLIRSSIAGAALILMGASAAHADCIVGAGSRNTRVALKALVPPAASYAAAPAAGFGTEQSSIVGLWTVTFLVGDGPDLFDVGFELWHADGTEVTIDTAVPPAAGNICVGVWDRVAPNSVKLHHVGWNWDLGTTPASFAGVFVLDMAVTLGRDGGTFSGRYVTDSYDTDGKVIPAFHAEGAVTATRITPNSKKW